MAWLIGRDWRKLAACRSIDPDLFFPVSSDGKPLEQAAEASAVCACCLLPTSPKGMTIMTLRTTAAGGIAALAVIGAQAGHHPFLSQPRTVAGLVASQS